MSETNPVGNRVIPEYWAGARAALLQHNPYSKTCQCSTQRRVCKCGHVYFVTACQSQPFCVQCSKPIHDYSQDMSLDEEMAYLDADEMIPAEKQEAAKLLSAGPMCGEPEDNYARMFPPKDQHIADCVKIDKSLHFMSAMMETLNSIPDNPDNWTEDIHHILYVLRRAGSDLLQQRHYIDSPYGIPMSAVLSDRVNKVL